MSQQKMHLRFFRENIAEAMKKGTPITRIEIERTTVEKARSRLRATTAKPDTSIIFYTFFFRNGTKAEHYMFCSGKEEATNIMRDFVLGVKLSEDEGGAFFDRQDDLWASKKKGALQALGFFDDTIVLDAALDTSPVIKVGGTPPSHGR